MDNIIYKDIKMKQEFLKQANGYSWEDVKDKKINTIGYYWQSGIGTGIVDTHMIWFVYFGTPNKNDTYFVIAEITEQEYIDLQNKYKNFLYNNMNENSNKKVSSNIIQEIKEYVYQSKIITETLNLF